MSGLHKLKSGFRKFRKHYFEEHPELYEKLTIKGQSPEVLVIACCDSRVHPAQVLATEPGDIFVIRNVANLVPPFEDDGKSHGTSAAIEFAVKHLKVKHIIVFGHAQCGGVRSLMEGEHDSHKYSFIDPWMSTVRPAREKVLKQYSEADFDRQCRYCEEEVIRVSLKNLMSFPFIKEAVDAGSLTVGGWHFDITKGEINSLDEKTDQFVSILGS